VLIALVAAGVVAAAAIVLGSGLGVRAAGTTPVENAVSGAWMCPHGGGEKWHTSLYVANPGPSAAMVRIVNLDPDRASSPQQEEVPAGTTKIVPVPSSVRTDSTMVEYFGGWVAAGWTSLAGGRDVGVTAEPCLSQASTDWTLPDGTTQENQAAWIVVMNPFASDAVFDVTGLSEHDAPATSKDLTDYVLHGGRSTAFKLNDLLEGEQSLAASVHASIGRVAVATLGISARTGVRSSEGWPGAAPHQMILPGGGDAGTSEVVVANPSDKPVSYAATALGPRGSTLAPGLRQGNVTAQASASQTVHTKGPTALVVRAAGPTGIVAARRSEGRGTDLGSAGGVAGPAAGWVVLPATGPSPQIPGVFLTNPGTQDVSVRLTTLPASDAVDPVTSSLTVKAGHTIEAPPRLLADHPFSSVLVVAESGTVVAAAGSSSQGDKGIDSYAVSTGARIPDADLPRTP
jgi:hypothetical protein